MNEITTMNNGNVTEKVLGFICDTVAWSHDATVHINNNSDCIKRLTSCVKAMADDMNIMDRAISLLDKNVSRLNVGCTVGVVFGVIGLATASLANTRAKELKDRLDNVELNLYNEKTKTDTTEE
nr:MAG TPA: hypothetical protein [Caudoviricetes sp.]